MPKRDRAKYMRAYSAQREAGAAKANPNARHYLDLPDDAPWRTMNAEDAYWYLLSERRERRRLAREAAKATGVLTLPEVRFPRRCRIAFIATPAV